jgi:hypothetical protein
MRLNARLNCPIDIFLITVVPIEARLPLVVFDTSTAAIWPVDLFFSVC